MKQNNRHYKFSEVLTIINGRNQRKVEDVNGCFPIYGSGGIMGWANDFICPENTIVIGRKGSINNPIFVNQKFWNVDTAFGLVANPSLLLPKYLYYFCVSFNFEALNTTVTIPSLTKANLLNVDIPVPSIKEQEEIVSLLDHLVSLSNTRRIQLQKLDALASSRFVEMFGDPIENPRKWEIHCLSDYIVFLTSGSRGWSQFFSDSGEYFITIKNVKNGRLDLENVQFVVPPNNAEALRTKVQEGDLLVSITADLGRTAVVSKDVADYGAYINQHLSCIRLNRQILEPFYVASFLESDAGKRQFDAKNQSAVKAGLNFNSIKSLRIPVPPLSLQQDFIAFIEQLDKSKVTIRKSIEKLEILYKALLQEYFG